MADMVTKHKCHGGHKDSKQLKWSHCRWVHSVLRWEGGQRASVNIVNTASSRSSNCEARVAWMGTGYIWGHGKADQRGAEQELSAGHSADMVGEAVQRATGSVYRSAFQHVTLYWVLSNQVQTHGRLVTPVLKKAAATIVSWKTIVRYPTCHSYPSCLRRWSRISYSTTSSATTPWQNSRQRTGNSTAR